MSAAITDFDKSSNSAHLNMDILKHKQILIFLITNIRNTYKACLNNVFVDTF